MAKPIWARHFVAVLTEFEKAGIIPRVDRPEERDAVDQAKAYKESKGER